MMNYKKFILLPVLLLFFGVAMGQGQQDVVYLKDGSMVRGVVVEYLVGDHLRMRTVEGKYHDFPADQIKKIKSGKSKLKMQVPVKEIGYYNNTTFGLLFGNLGYGLDAIPSLQMINGLQYHKWNFGLGVGLEAIYSQAWMPLFADVRYNLRKDAFSPFVGLNMGLSPRLSANDDYYGWYNRSYSHGQFAGLNVGIRNYSKRNLGFSLQLGYRFQQLVGKYDMEFWNGTERVIVPVDEKAVLHRVELRFGILFN